MGITASSPACSANRSSRAAAHTRPACPCPLCPHVLSAQPLVGDWRQQLLGDGAGEAAAEQQQQQQTAQQPAAKKRRKHEGEAAVDEEAGVAAVSGTSSSKPDLTALSAGLPKGWRALYDAASGMVYYGNKKTKVRTSKG